jgi:GNAT superfamily N-acetyltransferase
MPLVIRPSCPEEVYRVIHQACEETHVYRGKTSLQSALEGLSRFDCYAIEKEGEQIGAVIFRGNEGHIAVLAKYRGAWAGRAFYRFMQEQVNKRGVIHARCGNPDALKFIQRLVNRGYVCLENS